MVFHDPPHTPPLPEKRTSKEPLVGWLSVLFLLSALACLPAGTDSPVLTSLAIVFISIVLEAIPFMLLGSLIGGLIEVFVSREKMMAILPQKPWAAVCIAAAAGMIFPVCECAVVPVVRRLVGKGLPLAAAIGYLLGGPIVNPIVAASTALAYAFDWSMVALRLGFGYLIAVAIGLIMGRLFDGRSALQRPMLSLACNDASCDCGHHHISPPEGWLAKIGAAFSYGMEDFLAVAHYLVIGAFLAAVAQSTVERSIFLQINDLPGVSVGLMMLLAILLNLCSEADAFIAASFQGIMPRAAQLAFLLTGPMFDLKLLLMYQRLLQPRAIAALAVLVIGVVAGVCLGWQGLFGEVAP